MKLQHLVITRFAIRIRDRSAAHDVFWNTPDPLERHMLENRMKLFELFALAAVRWQTNQNFTWLVVVDRELPAIYRDRIRAMAKDLPNAHIVDFEPGWRMETISWFARFLLPGVTHVITTNLDDDDMVFPGCVEYVQRFLQERAAAGTLPSLQAIGCPGIRQWDFVRTRHAPLGFVKPWHRPARFGSGGFTLAAEYPAYDISIQALSHGSADMYFDPAASEEDRTVAILHRAAEARGEDWRAWSSKERVHSVEAPSAQAIFVNHVENDQRMRLFEAWSRRNAVRGPEDFPGFPIDFEKARRTIDDFELSLRVLFRLLSRDLRSILNPHATLRQRLWLARRMALLPVWFLVGKSVSRQQGR